MARKKGILLVLSNIGECEKPPMLWTAGGCLVLQRTRELVPLYLI